MKSLLLRTLFPLGIALLLALAAVGTWGQLPSGTAYRKECPPEDIPLARDKSLGVNADLSLLSDASRSDVLTSMGASGLRWLRQRFPWDRIEPERGAFDWAIWDRIVSDVAQQGMELVAILDGSPSWALGSDDSGNLLAPPHEVSDYGAFVATFAHRYGRDIDYYELWDEPNIAPHWGKRWVDPSAYAHLLREGAIQLRAADPGAVVILAALAPNVEVGGANMSDVAYLDALYEVGAEEWFDVVAAEPYGFDFAAGEPAAYDRLSFSRAELLRAVMQSREDLSTPIWAVAFGWVGDEASGYAAAENLREAVTYARRNWPWMGPMLWAAWSPADARGQYALAQSTRDPSTLLSCLSGLPDWTKVASAGWYPPDHASGTYQGNWRITSEGVDIGATGDSLDIAFVGTRIDLMLRRGDYRAFLYVTVDGEPANGLPRDGDGRAYVVLYDPSGGEATVTLARGLRPGGHSVHLIAEGGWGQWAVVGWSACCEDRRPALWLPGGLAVGAVLALVVALVFSWPVRLALLGAARRLAERYRALDARVALVLGVVASLGVYASVGTLPSLGALTLLTVVLFLRPEVGLSLVALALPFWQPGKPLFGKVFSMVEILTWLTLAGWMAHQLLGRLGTTQHESLAPKRPVARAALSRLSAVDWGVIALALVGLLSLLWAKHAREAARELRTVIWGSALYYLLLRSMARDRTSRWRVLDAWVMGGALISVVALGQWVFGRGLITAEGVSRVRGFYGSPNNLALYLGRLLPLAVAMGLWDRAGRRRWLYGTAAVLLAAAIALTYSRGAWLLGVPLSLLFLAGLRGRRPLQAVSGALLAALLLALLFIGPDRLVSLTDLTQGTALFRLQLWRSSLLMVRDHPILGVGLDNFLYAYRSTYVLPTAWEELNLSHPHNLMLDFWLRLGLPGLAILAWLLVAFFRQGLRAQRFATVPREALLVLGLMAGMVDFLAHGLVDNAFFLVDLAFVFMLMLALVQCSSDSRHHGPAPERMEREKCEY